MEAAGVKMCKSDHEAYLVLKHNSEAWTQLYNTLEIRLREQIAKEIEATCECPQLSSGWHCQAEQMAAIARGEVKE